MIDTNQLIIPFIQNNSLIILFILFLLSLIKVIPPEWCGFWKYVDNDENKGPAPKATILNWMLHMIIDSLIRSFVLSLLSAFGLKNMITLIIFIVTSFDVVVNQQISLQSVALVGIGIITLYLDKLVDNGSKISLFGSLLKWEKKA